MKFRSLLRVSAALLAASQVFGQSTDLAWPKVTREMKPWTRWWWLGNIADPTLLRSEMASYAAVGLGGLELTCIYGVHGYEDRFVPYLSPAWVNKFQYTLGEARRLGLGIDLSNGSGWPFGGPWLGDADAAHTLLHKSYTVAAGGRLTEAVSCVQEPLLSFTRPRNTTLAELKQPVTANPNLQDLAIDQVRFPRTVPLSTLMAFPEKGAPIDLTSKTASDGKLDWTAPVDQGNWTLHALFLGQHGKMVERAAPGAEGYALDHLSSKALKNYLARFDDAFKGLDTSNLRSFFNDSYEVDDAKGESNFTQDFLAQFQDRRGYDLRQHLPELFSTPETDASSRVLSDYRETVSDLLLDEFTKPWTAWAHARGSLTRDQAHNSPANILDLYAASDIPEQEGSNIYGIKFASSAAHVAGKALASAEAATWLNEHFLTTLAELKYSVDTYLLGGINHIVYHGTALSPFSDPWPGFQFYASVELNPQNPFWDDFASVNAYVTLALSFLQSGSPDEDVLLYYNIHDLWAKRGNGRMPHLGHGNEPVGVGARDAAITLRDTGCGFDFVSDRLLEGVSFDGKSLASAKARYAAIVVPETRLMPEATLAKLVSLASSGATILVQKQLPEDAPGLHPKTEAFAKLLAQIRAKMTTQEGIAIAEVGQGRFLIADDLSQLLDLHTGIKRESMWTLGLEYLRRRSPDGHIYFIVNRGSNAINGWVPLHVGGAAAALYDPMTGRAGVAAFRSRSADDSDVYLQLEPGESCIVDTHATSITGTPWPYWKRSQEMRVIESDWQLTFIKGGPVLPPERTVKLLGSWTDLGGDDVKAFSGTATYSLHLPRPFGKRSTWLLDLGTVADSARVSLNGRELAVLIQPPWQVIIPDEAFSNADNTLEITVTNIAANRIADMDRRGIPWKKFYNTNMPARFPENTGADGLFSAAKWKPRKAGLLGPVRFNRVDRIVFDTEPLLKSIPSD